MSRGIGLAILGLAGAGAAVALSSRARTQAQQLLSSPFAASAMDAARQGNTAALDFLNRRQAERDSELMRGAYSRAPGYVQQAIRHYFPESEWGNAAAIAECESGFNPNAHNTIGEDSRGLFQINVGPGANTDLAGFRLFDPFQNARAARIVWNRQGWRGWLNCARRQGLV